VRGQKAYPDGNWPVSCGSWLLSHSSLRRSEPQSSAEHLERAVRLNSGKAIAHHNLGFVLLALQRPEEALAECKRGLELTPKSAEIDALLARILTEQPNSSAMSR
jgi:tetratricopeptide (TPR) repeat protein